MIEFVKGRVTEERAINEAEAVVYATLYSGLSFKIAMGNILILGDSACLHPGTVG
ncbi:MAG: hypothetical protein MK481_08825 [SAR324 cluster bacterium]|nr:hypothetical protein [SAR324 cluster bacterium]